MFCVKCTKNTVGLKDPPNEGTDIIGSNPTMPAPTNTSPVAEKGVDVNLDEFIDELHNEVGDYGQGDEGTLPTITNAPPIQDSAESTLGATQPTRDGLLHCNTHLYGLRQVIYVMKWLSFLLPSVKVVWRTISHSTTSMQRSTRCMIDVSRNFY